MICEKYSSRVLEKTKCLVRQIKTGIPRLTKTNHSELYPEVLNSLNKNTSNEMAEYLHDKIRNHATKQARQNHSIFPCSSANFLFLGLLSHPWCESTFKKLMLKLKEQLQIVSKYRSVGIALQDFYHTIEPHD